MPLVQSGLRFTLTHLALLLLNLKTEHGDPDVIRTHDLAFRKRLLYPAELRDHARTIWRQMQLWNQALEWFLRTRTQMGDDF